MIRVEVLDTSPVFVEGLKQVLTGAGMLMVRATGSPHDQPFWHADVVLLDPLAMSMCDYFCALRHVAETARLCAVLIVASSTAAMTRCYTHVGAASVISKKDPPESMIDAVRAAVQRSRPRSRSTHCAAPTADTLAPGIGQELGGEQARLLSGREQQVLLQIARGLTHDQVARRLSISRHTVDTYVKRIRSKLGVGNKAELTRAAVRGLL